MAIIKKTAAAWKDYREIWTHIALQGKENAASELLRTFDSKLPLLAENPLIGPARFELRIRMRSFPVGSYILFYRPIRGGIELMRVIHGARNLQKVFKR